MRLLIERYNYDDKQTLGRLHLLSYEDYILRTWDCLELSWKNNFKGVSCIPEGTYKVCKHNSPKFGKSLWVQDVPNRSEILIHRGNYNSDILGCIIIGMDLGDINNDGYLDVTQSVDAIKELLELTKLIDSLMLTITSS